MKQQARQTLLMSQCLISNVTTTFACEQALHLFLKDQEEGIKAMELGKIHYFEKVESHQHREFIQAHNHCILCGTTLELRHVLTDAGLEIKEEAHCPQCDLRTRAKVYSVH